MILESAVSRKANKYAKSVGWLCIKLMSPNFAGLPDYLYVRDGEYVFVEFKRPGGKPRKLQRAVHKLLRKHGAVVLAIDTVEDFKEIMK